MRRALAFAASICATFAAWPALAANLVANPGFETGDFTGWTLAGETRPDHSFVSDMDTYPGWNEWLPHAGDAFAALGAVGSDLSLSQTIATTPGASYTFRFHLGSDGEKPNAITAIWDGTPVLALADASETPGHDLIHGPAAAAYASYSFTAVASGPATTIRFAARNRDGWWALDDVSVTELPEPTLLASLGAGILALAACAKGRQRATG